ncbi:MAG TPA: hypothetical protein VFB72_06400, partial [Verrucomicrobiae bacterium]|nr:hypothetical protein [Verrucomicrobiae bacterium]
MKPDFTILIVMLGLIFAAPLRAADQTNSATGLDYNSFDIISKRNIFNPNRSNRPIRNEGPRVRVDSFTLVGTMSYDKGEFAFFDGTSSEFRKAYKPADTIAGYRIGEVDHNGITLLAAGNKVIHLAIGMEMKRQDGGPWELLARAEPIASTNPAEPADIAAKA